MARALAVGAVGLLALAIGVANWSRYAAVRETGQTTTNAVDTGRVVVAGIADAEVEPMRTPVTDRPALCYHVAVSQPDRDGWPLVGTATETTAFCVSDRWGEIPVDHDGGRLLLDGAETAASPLGRVSDSYTERTIEAGETLPRPTVDWLADCDIPVETTDGAVEAETRLREYALEPGTEVVVVGKGADTVAAVGPEQQAVTVPDDGTSAVVPGTPEQVETTLAEAAVGNVRFGAVFTLLAFGSAIALRLL